MQLKNSKNKVDKMETKELIGFRTIKRGDETVRIPVYKKKGTKDFIQKSIKKPGRVREIIQKWYGSDGFDSKGRIKPEYLIKAKQKAKEEHNRSLEDAIDLSMRLKKMDESHPYGESRAEAEAEVQKLREEGDKARLIKTNEKNDLYAPYEGTLPVDKSVNEALVKSDAKPVKITYKDAIEKMKPVSGDLRIEGDTRKGKIYAAVITGTDPKYGLKREFLNGDRTYTDKGRYVTIDYHTNLKPGTIIETGEGGSWKNNYGYYYIVTTKGIEPFKSNYNGNNKLFIKDLIKAREKAMEGKKITN